jgi:hypothetical protein
LVIEAEEIDHAKGHLLKPSTTVIAFAKASLQGAAGFSGLNGPA